MSKARFPARRPIGRDWYRPRAEAFCSWTICTRSAMDRALSYIRFWTTASTRIWAKTKFAQSRGAAIICAAEAPRWEAIKSEAKLPESFINRVEQLVLRIPPLRARPEDIELQANTYVEMHSRQVGEPMELSDSEVLWLVDFGFPGSNSRKLRDFLRGVVAANGRVTDYLDVAELEEYAHETGLLERTQHERVPVPAGRPCKRRTRAAKAPMPGWPAMIPPVGNAESPGSPPRH